MGGELFDEGETREGEGETVPPRGVATRVATIEEDEVEWEREDGFENGGEFNVIEGTEVEDDEEEVESRGVETSRGVVASRGVEGDEKEFEGDAVIEWDGEVSRGVEIGDVGRELFGDAAKNFVVVADGTSATKTCQKNKNNKLK